ncbi:amino acid ABC transporter substrate-binding protein [Desulfoprunum benzoelyticum]|uniref:General L-amino acid transport system substrate-binding protein n=1 Tax=Desulfoprunum benzoelyticum TaxID=1506996 RepID=A0A840V535_9BACT|nr:amino acid ABC transporter substrate-binding protein [Desulfoprunum benzoelyticum]MBB5348191.1 general L-amino acid transport system substrate-binding protein [Desulfoprunum benzoelyticum]MBM9530881.1 amino acid ABC transporter substrate-binding protein [Desulfoprunum benzoelyticum]
MKPIIRVAVAISVVLAAGFANAGTRDEVLQRGYLQCGVSTGVPGFSHPDDNGNWVGLDVDFCRAVAAATLGDASKVKYIPLNSRECFAALQSGEIDLLSRGSTYTLTRDSSLGLNFAGVTYYDGQGFLIAKKLAAKEPADLKGAAICVLAGTTSEANLAAYFRQHGMDFRPVIFDTSPETLKGLETGRCDVLTSDLSQLHGLRLKLAHPEKYVILPTVISKEPLGPAVRQGDDNWFDIVKWTLFALVNAEELGLTSATVDEMMHDPDAAIQKFVGRQGIKGEGLGLKDDWAVQIVRQVGNYGEIFARNVGGESPLQIDRGLNNLWNRGGLQYAPPLQ